MSSHVFYHGHYHAFECEIEKYESWDLRFLEKRKLQGTRNGLSKPFHLILGYYRKFEGMSEGALILEKQDQDTFAFPICKRILEMCHVIGKRFSGKMALVTNLMLHEICHRACPRIDQ